MRLRPELAAFACAALTSSVASCAAADGSALGGDANDPSVAYAPDPVTRARGLTIYPRLGSLEDDDVDALGPALVLFGGTPKVPGAARWAHAQVNADDRRYAGDVVVLTTDADDSVAQSMMSAAYFNSAVTVRVLDNAGDDDFRSAGAVVDYAEVVLVIGDDTEKLGRWKRTPLAAAIQAAFGRGAVIGGSGAGASMLGDFAFDGGAAVTTGDAIADPYASGIRFARPLIDVPVLEALLVESRFKDDDRFGRLAAFMARQVADGTLASTPPRVFGIGVDDGAAALVDRFGRVAMAQNDGADANVYVLDGGAPDRVAPGQPLAYSNLAVARLDAPGETFDMTRSCGTAFRYTASVNGGHSPPYAPSDPYGAVGLAVRCP